MQDTFNGNSCHVILHIYSNILKIKQFSVRIMPNKIILYAYRMLEDPTNTNNFERGFQYFMTILIAANVVFVIIESEKAIFEQYQSLFFYFDVFSVTVFTIEYIGRIVVCKVNPKYKNSRYGTLRFIASPMMLADLVAIMPFFMAFFLPFVDLRIIRVIRLLRLFRMFHLTKYIESMNILIDTFKAKSSDLTVAFFILFITLIFASSLMYGAEHEAQPEAFPSILQSMWWGVITLTTIGYGDVYPVTGAGKIIGAGIAILGIAVYAIPSGIMASAFIEMLRKKKGDKCPHCGKDIH